LLTAPISSQRGHRAFIGASGRSSDWSSDWASASAFFAFSSFARSTRSTTASNAAFSRRTSARSASSCIRSASASSDTACSVNRRRRCSTSSPAWQPASSQPQLASHSGRAHRGRLECPHRGLQPDYQTNQASRLRLPQHDQLPTPYPEPHCGHPTAEISSMNGTNPAEIRRAPLLVQRGRDAVD
jgi:hypothetical protein